MANCPRVWSHGGLSASAYGVAILSTFGNLTISKKAFDLDKVCGGRKRQNHLYGCRN
jgi:hypothetical protein